MSAWMASGSGRHLYLQRRHAFGNDRLPLNRNALVML